jgi:hypothetical protein
MRANTRSHRQIQTFAHIERVRIGGDELRPEPAKKRQHFFPYGVNEDHFRQVDEQLNARGEARSQRPSVFSIITGESAFKSYDQSVSGIAYFDAEHQASLEYAKSQERITGQARFNELIHTNYLR